MEAGRGYRREIDNMHIRMRGSLREADNLLIGATDMTLYVIVIISFKYNQSDSGFRLKYLHIEPIKPLHPSSRLRLLQTPNRKRPRYNQCSHAR